MVASSKSLSVPRLGMADLRGRSVAVGGVAFRALWRFQECQQARDRSGGTPFSLGETPRGSRGSLFVGSPPATGSWSRVAVFAAVTVRNYTFPPSRLIHEFADAVSLGAGG